MKLRGFARGLLPNEGAIYHKHYPMSRLFSLQTKKFLRLLSDLNKSLLPHPQNMLS
jgi:hypothetical protein